MGLTRAEAERLGIGHLYPRRERRIIPPAPPPQPYANWPGHWEVTIPNWRPGSDSSELHRLGSRIRRKTADRKVIAQHLTPLVPPAFTRRRVTFTVRKPHGPWPDPPNLNKSLLDALKTNLLLRDDSFRWCEVMPGQIAIGEFGTTIVLEDIPDEGGIPK